jgi:excisionase family DNA binding protein
MKTRHMLTRQQVAQCLGISTRTLYDWVAAGKFPQPQRFGRKCVRWKAAAVEAFLDAYAEPENVQE